MPVASTAACDLYYEEQGSGTSLLFIHGLLTDAGTWSQQVANLSASFRCVAFDRRGNSRSRPSPSAGLALESHARDTAELIRTLALEPCILVASSMGGVVAIELMRRWPELVAGAVLSEPAIFSLDPNEGPSFLRRITTEVQEVLVDGGLRPAVELFSRLVDPVAWLDSPPEDQDRMAANFPALLAALRSEIYRIDPDELGRIGQPCLLVYGDQSPAAFQLAARRLSELLPNAQLVGLPSSRHLTYLHQPRAFSELVRRFASQI